MGQYHLVITSFKSISAKAIKISSARDATLALNLFLA